ncbi:hypothetical protein [Leucobacter iarius]|uniref:Uncharacterized protein n=1 Tax=Leucobacter iarius TaxID=333963 RepID=A0ABN2LJR5_9MICO
MPYTSPKFRITGPSATSEFRKLGAELQAMLLGIDNTLASFDYNGADPGLVLSRLAALEARVTAAEAATPVVQTGWTGTQSVPAGGFTPEIIITYPRPFKSKPALALEIVGADARDGQVLIVNGSETATGVRVRLGVAGNIGRNFGAIWSVVGVPA